MKIDVPYFSQISDVSSVEWHNRACGVACLAMLIEMYKPGTIVGLDPMIQHGLTIDAFTERGWSHPRLVIMAHNYGVLAYMEEFRSGKADFHEEFFSHGVKKIKEHLDLDLPVIISTYKNFTEEGKFHMVVLTGYEMEDGKFKGFHYSDPDAPNAADGKHKFVGFDQFKDKWRRLCIFMYPQVRGTGKLT